MTNSQVSTPKVVGTGLTVLDKVYQNGEFEFSQLGGSCGNVLVSLAKLKCHVTPLIVLGKDEIAKNLISELKESGVDVRFIIQKEKICSTSIKQDTNSRTGEHNFIFERAESQKFRNKFTSISENDVAAASELLSNCKVFYADRISKGILDAMRIAKKFGALIFFEPSSSDDEYFEHALMLSTIVKFASDRLDTEDVNRVNSGSSILIETHGSQGLQIIRGKKKHWCDAKPAAKIFDTSGAGDMVSIGILYKLLHNSSSSFFQQRFEDILAGIDAGQKLAAENCSYLGARGIFREKGVARVREILGANPD